jgi:cytochrome c553
MLADPRVAAARTAWDAAAARGKALFSDPSLGTTGKSCADCHSADSLGRVKDAYPKYNAGLGRAESLEERLDTMVRVKLGGDGLPLGDERSTALAIYLRSLR